MSELDQLFEEIFPDWPQQDDEPQSETKKPKPKRLPRIDPEIVQKAKAESVFGQEIKKAGEMLAEWDSRIPGLHGAELSNAVGEKASLTNLIETMKHRAAFVSRTDEQMDALLAAVDGTETAAGELERARAALTDTRAKRPKLDPVSGRPHPEVLDAEERVNALAKASHDIRYELSNRLVEKSREAYVGCSRISARCVRETRPVLPRSTLRASNGRIHGRGRGAR